MGKLPEKTALNPASSDQQNHKHNDMVILRELQWITGRKNQWGVQPGYQSSTHTRNPLHRINNQTGGDFKLSRLDRTFNKQKWSDTRPEVRVEFFSGTSDHKRRQKEIQNPLGYTTHGWTNISKIISGQLRRKTPWNKFKLLGLS